MAKAAAAAALSDASSTTTHHVKYKLANQQKIECASYYMDHATIQWKECHLDWANLNGLAIF